VGDQLSEVFRYHQGCNKEEALENSIALLKMGGNALPRDPSEDYPSR